MSRIITKGATSQSVYVEILDSTSTTGGRKTGLVYNTAGITAYYVRGGGSAVAITLATLAAANSVWSSGGFKEVDATNMPGIYRLDVPDAAFASGADSVVVTIKGATGAAQVSSECQLIGADLQDAVRAGLTALPSAAAGANGGLPTGDANAAVKVQAGTGTGQLDFTSGVVKASLVQILGTALTETAGQIAAAFKKFFDEASPTGTINSIPDAVAGASGGLFIAGSNAATAANITGNLTGNVTGSVGSVTGAVGSVGAGGIASTSFAAGAIDAAAVAADAIGASELAADAVAEIADAVWDEVLSGHLTAGTTGNALNAAGSAGDPWSTALPGAYGAGTAGKIIGDNITGNAFTRLGAPAGASVSADVAAIKAVDDAIKLKTDNLPASPAAVGSAMTLTSAYDFAKGTVQVTESYAADGAAPTPVQALLLIQQMLTEFGIAATTLTVKRVDGVTTAATFTLDSSTAPTAITRSG